MGTVAMNQYIRLDSLLYTLVYPMKPMVKTRTLDLISFDEMPGGQNACIAVMSYSGYDIEDAIVLNKASVDRGFGRCMVIKKQTMTRRKYPNGMKDEIFAKPAENEVKLNPPRKVDKKFDKLDEDGIVLVGERVVNGDVLVNKYVPNDTQPPVDKNGSLLTPGQMSNGEPIPHKPSPLCYKNPTESYVDQVLITSSDNEDFLVKLSLRQTRRPEVGDKFSSRHGQKGVCGIIVNQQDMPFDDHGTCPDLIMNPHGFPSRMTVGKLLELVVGKAGVFNGRQAYAR